MERISKPHLVDLLRIFDKRRWLTPRIRYASVRSKPELIKDLKAFFFTYDRGRVMYFKLKGSAQAALSHLPRISYHLKERRYLFDDRPFDVSVESRKRVRFSISHVPVTLFARSEGQLSTRTAAASAQVSPEPDTSAPQDS